MGVTTQDTRSLDYRSIKTCTYGLLVPVLGDPRGSIIGSQFN